MSVRVTCAGSSYIGSNGTEALPERRHECNLARKPGQRHVRSRYEFVIGVQRIRGWSPQFLSRVHFYTAVCVQLNTVLVLSQHQVH